MEDGWKGITVFLGGLAADVLFGYFTHFSEFWGITCLVMTLRFLYLMLSGGTAYFKGQKMEKKDFMQFIVMYLILFILFFTMSRLGLRKN